MSSPRDFEKPDLTEEDEAVKRIKEDFWKQFKREDLLSGNISGNIHTSFHVSHRNRKEEIKSLPASSPSPTETKAKKSCCSRLFSRLWQPYELSRNAFTNWVNEGLYGFRP